MAAGLILEMVIRWTLRDRLPVLAVLYYLARPELLAAWAAALAVLHARQRRWRQAAFVGLLASACLLDALWSDFRVEPSRAAGRAAPLDRNESGPRETLRILLWNVSSGWGGWEAMARTVAGERPDVVGLVEAWRSGVDRTALLRTNPSLDDVTDDTYGLVVGVRGRIVSCESRVFERRGRLKLVRAVVHARPVTILLVDIPGDPLVFRRPYLAAVAALAAEIDGPLIVMGDFNTPPDSLHFAPLRDELSSAFERSGRGYACTWPSPLPVLALDQIWLSPDFVLLACETRATLRSDHWLVRTDVQLGQ